MAEVVFSFLELLDIKKIMASINYKNIHIKIEELNEIDVFCFKKTEP